MEEFNSNIDITKDQGRVVVHDSAPMTAQMKKTDYTGPFAALMAVFLGIVVWMVWDNYFAKSKKRKKKNNKNKKDGFLTTLPYQVQNSRRR